MEQLFSDRGVDPARVQARLEQAAAEVGLPFGKRDKTYSSTLALELSKWAESRGKGEQIHDAVFRAYFVDGSNISDIFVLIELGVGLGFSEKEVADVLVSRAFKEAVELDWSRSRNMRIKVAPTMVFNEKKLVGAQKYGKMERFITANNAKKRNSQGGN